MVHPKVLEAYRVADYEYISTAHDDVEARFLRLTEDKAVKSIVNKVVRVKQPSGQEFIFYEERLESHDHVGNEIHLTQQVGRYQKPMFRMEYDPGSKRIIAKEIVKHVWEYEIPYTPEKLEEIMNRGLESEMSCMAMIANRKYGISSYEDFKAATFDELVAMGKSGKSLYELRLQREAEEQIHEQGRLGQTISATAQLQHVQTRRQEEQQEQQQQQTKPHLRKSD